MRRQQSLQLSRRGLAYESPLEQRAHQAGVSNDTSAVIK